MKDRLEELARWALENDGTPFDYDGDDLVNALLILQHVSFSIAWKRLNAFGLDAEQMGTIAEEHGKNMRQSIHLFTGIDPTDAVRGESWPDIVSS